MRSFGNLFAEFLAAPSEEWEVRYTCHCGVDSCVAWDAVFGATAPDTGGARHPQGLAAQRRPRMTDSFFDYLQVKISTMDPSTQRQEQEGA